MPPRPPPGCSPARLGEPGSPTSCSSSPAAPCASPARASAARPGHDAPGDVHPHGELGSTRDRVRQPDADLRPHRDRDRDLRRAPGSRGRRDLPGSRSCSPSAIPAQAVIGGITVLTDLNPWVVVAPPARLDGDHRRSLVLLAVAARRARPADAAAARSCALAWATFVVAWVSALRSAPSSPAPARTPGTPTRRATASTRPAVLPVARRSGLPVRRAHHRPARRCLRVQGAGDGTARDGALRHRARPGRDRLGAVLLRPAGGAGRASTCVRTSRQRGWTRESPTSRPDRRYRPLGITGDHEGR